MKDLDFDKFYDGIKKHQFPSMCGNHFTKEQYDKVYEELKRQKDCINNWIEKVLQTRVQKKEDRRTD